MTELEFYDEVINQTGYEGKKKFWSVYFLSIQYRGIEFRVKYRKSKKNVRLDIINGTRTDVKFIDTYQINPPNCLRGNESKNNLSIFRDMNIDSKEDVQATIEWINKYIPKMYDELL